MHNTENNKIPDMENSKEPDINDKKHNRNSCSTEINHALRSLDTPHLLEGKIIDHTILSMRNLMIEYF